MNKRKLKMRMRIVLTRSDSQKRPVPEKTGVPTANFSIIYYMAHGAEMALTGVTGVISQVLKATGVFSHPGARQIKRDSA